MYRNMFLFTFLFSLLHVQAQDRPNILWLVTEDMSPYLSCYGNKLITTPNLDKLAAQGIRFTQAHSNGVQCSPSRSTIISGKYAVSLGTDIHRERRPVIDTFYFPIYLRKAGYYCTNNAKEDYNSMKTPATVWDMSNNKAQYFNRPDKKQPFFAVYNYGGTHMVRVATRTVEGRGTRTVSMDKVEVPAYIPDLPEVRDDISWNMDAILKLDDWIGKKLEELKAKGEDENTIIFFYSDHGGTVPRGKAYVYETGSHVPLLAYFPPKWKHLAATPVPSVSDRLVAFVDFAPTVLHLAGVPVPNFMIGKPFFTEAATKAENQRQYIFTFRANQGPSYAPSRALTDGHYTLLWNFQSAYPNGTRQDYQWQMPAQQAWDKAHMAGQLTNPVHKKFWLPVSTFELYDVAKDSLCVNDLAANPTYAKELARLKAVLQNELHQQKDLGFIPPEYRQTLQKRVDLFTLVRQEKINIDEVITAAETASMRDKALLPKLTTYLKHKNPMVQYWGASGICGLAKTKVITSLPAEATRLLVQAEVIGEVKCLLAEALVYTGNSKQGLDYLVSQAQANFSPAAAALQNLGNLALPAASTIETMVLDKRLENKFFLRSVLINCGKLPYSDLYKLQEGEKLGD